MCVKKKFQNIYNNVKKRLVQVDFSIEGDTKWWRTGLSWKTEEGIEISKLQCFHIRDCTPFSFYIYLPIDNKWSWLASANERILIKVWSFKPDLWKKGKTCWKVDKAGRERLIYCCS